MRVVVEMREVCERGREMFQFGRTYKYDHHTSSYSGFVGRFEDCYRNPQNMKMILYSDMIGYCCSDVTVGVTSGHVLIDCVACRATR